MEFKTCKQGFQKYAAKYVQVSENPVQPSPHELTLIGEFFEDQSEEFQPIPHGEDVNSDTNDSTTGHHMEFDIFTNLVEIATGVDNGKQNLNEDLATEVGDDDDESGNKDDEESGNKNTEVDDHRDYNESGQDKAHTNHVDSNRI